MAMCPRCFKEKAMLADKCPHCTADVPVGDQVGFSAGVTITSAIIILVLLSLIFG
jgi:uncharacterized paraquat-inducible protein A